MPWQASDAKDKTKKAMSPGAAAKWARIANKVLAETGDEGRAVRVANSSLDGSRKTKNAERRKMTMKGEMKDRMKAHAEGSEHYGMDPMLD
jgi:hypothetical protein